MQVGDMVRFAKWRELSLEQIHDSKKWPQTAKPYTGVLVKHDKLMGTADILHEGEIIKVRTSFVEKAGKKDFEKR